MAEEKSGTGVGCDGSTLKGRMFNFFNKRIETSLEKAKKQPRAKPGRRLQQHMMLSNVYITLQFSS